MAAFLLAVGWPSGHAGTFEILAQTGTGNPWSEWLPVFPSGLESSGWSSVRWHSPAGQCQVSPQRCLQPEQGVCPCW